MAAVVGVVVNGGGECGGYGRYVYTMAYSMPLPNRLWPVATHPQLPFLMPLNRNILCLPGIKFNRLSFYDWNANCIVPSLLKFNSPTIGI